jgi:LacI family transcriptional regulator, repressor for deo operon, udp, cdd, tsx, nupC, and nupG
MGGTVTTQPRRRRAGSAPTIYDVARETGVAPSTVSRAFSRPGRVNAETAEHVRAAAARLGYRSNAPACTLPAGRTGMVALVVPDVTNPVYSDITRGAEDAAALGGCTVLLADFRESGRLEREVIERALAAVDGLVLGDPRIPDSAIRMAAKRRPTVVLNRSVADVPSVVPDNPRGMRRVGEHLGALGHGTIVYLAGPEASWADGMRWRSLREAAGALDLRVRRRGPYPPTVAGGLAAADGLGRQSTTAVVAYNDLMAIGLMLGLQRAGVAVPREVSIVGFDNVFGSDFCTPALTTVAAPLRGLGAAGMRRLLTQLNGGPVQSPRPGVLPVELVVRESTAQPSRRRSSPARGTTSVSGSAAQASGSTSAGSR